MKALPIMEQRHFIFGKTTIEYSILPSSRKTMEIAVYPDSRVIVKTPLFRTQAEIDKKIQKRARWIISQLNYFRQFQPRTPDRKYVSGETHLYLGRQYRLKLFIDKEDSVKLTRGYFYVSCKNDITPEYVEYLLNRWFTVKAAVQFQKMLDQLWPKFIKLKVNKPKLVIRHMKRRWGSLSKKGTLTLNPELIKAPKECIEYVIIHELCHLKYHDHSHAFYKVLLSVIPEWEKIKHKLELSIL